MNAKILAVFGVPRFRQIGNSEFVVDQREFQLEADQNVEVVRDFV